MACGWVRRRAARRSSEYSHQVSGPRLIVTRRLVEVLKSSKEPIALAVAAHDVGQYIKHGGDKAKQ